MLIATRRSPISCRDALQQEREGYGRTIEGLNLSRALAAGVDLNGVHDEGGWEVRSTAVSVRSSRTKVRWQSRPCATCPNGGKSSASCGVNKQLRRDVNAAARILPHVLFCAGILIGVVQSRVSPECQRGGGRRFRDAPPAATAVRQLRADFRPWRRLID